MQYNICETCGADAGRAGLLIMTMKHGITECLNCHDTRRTGKVCIHTNLERTSKEIQKTIEILNEK